MWIISKLAASSRTVIVYGKFLARNAIRISTRHPQDPLYSTREKVTGGYSSRSLHSWSDSGDSSRTLLVTILRDKHTSRESTLISSPEKRSADSPAVLSFPVEATGQSSLSISRCSKRFPVLSSLEGDRWLIQPFSPFENGGPGDPLLTFSGVRVAPCTVVPGRRPADDPAVLFYMSDPAATLVLSWAARRTERIAPISPFL